MSYEYVFTLKMNAQQQIKLITTIINLQVSVLKEADIS